MKKFSIVVAMDEKNGIGKNGLLAWHLSADLKRFKEITSQVSSPQKKNVLIMGRKTWDSLPQKFRPLPGRINVVLTRTQAVLPGALVFTGLDEALQGVEGLSDAHEIFVIGGSQIYSQAVQHHACNQLFVTTLKGDFSCDAFFPAIPTNTFHLDEQTDWTQEGSISYRFCHYLKR